jgi:O-antigen ligase
MQRYRDILFALLAALIAGAPLPLGSNRDWAWSPLSGVVGLLLIMLALSALSKDERAFSHFRSLLVPALLVGLVACWGLLQASGLTPNSWINPIRLSTAPFLPEGGAALVAIEREQVLTGLMRLLLYAGVFVLSADLCADPRKGRILASVVVWSAVFYTVSAMAIAAVNRFAPVTGVTLFTPSPGDFTGPFVNRNNFSTYAAMAAVVAMAMTMRSIGDNARPDEGTAARWRRRLLGLVGKGGIWLVAVTILGTGILLAESRAGIACFALGSMTVVAFLSGSRGRWIAVGGVVIGVLGLVSLMPSGAAVMRRVVTLAEKGESDRAQLFAAAWQAIELRPLLGWGMNSFQSLYSVFQPVGISISFDKVHNTYLELAFDLGVAGAACLIFAVTWIAARCLRGYWERRQNRELPLLGVAATLVVGAHALVDFSLQIPAVTVVYMSLLGLAWAQSWSSRR